MPSSTLTSKGQITIPQEVRENLGLQTGDKVDFVQDERGLYQVVPLRSDIKALRGCFAGRVNKPVTIERMSEAIVEEAALRFRKTASRDIRGRK